MIWTRIAYAGIEIISIPAYAHVVTRVQIILYALPVATVAQANIVKCTVVTYRTSPLLNTPMYVCSVSRCKGEQEGGGDEGGGGGEGDGGDEVVVNQASGEG